jgi:Protein of unknown function (DUF2877)
MSSAALPPTLPPTLPRTPSGAVSSLLAPLVDGPPRACTVVGATSVSWHLHVSDSDGAGQEPEVSLISVQLPAAERLPCSLVVDSSPQIHLGDRGLIGGGLVRFDSEERSPACWFRPARPRVLAPSTFLAACRDLPIVEPVTIGLAGCAIARQTELLGRGPGLTPAGDDVLAAALVVRHSLGLPALGWPPAQLATATTPLSAELLRCAGRGYCCDRMASLMQALDRGDDPTEATQRLLSLGGTTGRAMLLGLKDTTDQLTRSLAA